MRGDIVYRVYGLHAGRERDFCFGAFRTAAEAQARIATLESKDERGWAKQYHNHGFVIREARVDTDFEIPSSPKPRDRYVVKTNPKSNGPGVWDSTLVEVLRRQASGTGLDLICEYERSYSMLRTFEPFRQGNRDYALISPHYTRTAVLDLSSGQIIAEETEKDGPGRGFCPVGFYVPDWWDLNDGTIIPGAESWDGDDEWPTGEFGFVWGCYWGDDGSWKVQYLDLRGIQRGMLQRDDRFGYVELATSGYANPCFSLEPPTCPSKPPPFINVRKYQGAERVTFAVEMGFDLATGELAREWRRLNVENLE